MSPLQLQARCHGLLLDVVAYAAQMLAFEHGTRQRPVTLTGYMQLAAVQQGNQGIIVNHA